MSHRGAQVSRHHPQVGQWAQSFSPKLLTGLAGWWRADLGFTVSSWADQSGLNRHLLQGTAGKQPVFSAAGGSNGRSMVTFDGVDDLMSATFALSQPEQVFVVCKFNTVASQAVLDGTVDVSMMLRQELGGTTANMFAGSFLTLTAVSTTAWHAYDLAFNGASSVASVDGAVNISGAVGAAAPGGITVGSRVTGSPANVSVSEVVLYNRILSANEEARVNAYLRARYAL